MKHDNSGAGDGNVVVRFDGRRDLVEQVREVWAGLPAWYVEDLRAGGVVERLHDAARYSSPSAQVDLRPDGGVTVLATHEQLVGGDNGQVFLGCRFLADPRMRPARGVCGVGRRGARRVGAAGAGSPSTSSRPSGPEDGVRATGTCEPSR